MQELSKSINFIFERIQQGNMGKTKKINRQILENSCQCIKHFSQEKLNQIYGKLRKSMINQ